MCQWVCQNTEVKMLLLFIHLCPVVKHLSVYVLRNTKFWSRLQKVECNKAVRAGQRVNDRWQGFLKVVLHCCVLEESEVYFKQTQIRVVAK